MAVNKKYELTDVIECIDQRIKDIKQNKKSGLEGRCQWYLVKELERLRDELQTLLDSNSLAEGRSANKNVEE